MAPTSSSSSFCWPLGFLLHNVPANFVFSPRRKIILALYFLLAALCTTALFVVGALYWNYQVPTGVLTQCVLKHPDTYYNPNGDLYPPPPTTLMRLFSPPNVFVIYTCADGGTLANSPAYAALGYYEPGPSFDHAPPASIDSLFFSFEGGTFAKTTAVMATTTVPPPSYQSRGWPIVFLIAGSFFFVLLFFLPTIGWCIILCNLRKKTSLDKTRIAPLQDSIRARDNEEEERVLSSTAIKIQNSV